MQLGVLNLGPYPKPSTPRSSETLNPKPKQEKANEPSGRKSITPRGDSKVAARPRSTERLRSGRRQATALKPARTRGRSMNSFFKPPPGSRV